MHAQGQGIRTTSCETALLPRNGADYSTDSFTGSIVHSLRICEENYKENCDKEKFRKAQRIKSETKEWPVGGFKVQVQQVGF